jgi:hypothetical protein
MDELIEFQRQMKLKEEEVWYYTRNHKRYDIIIWNVRGKKKDMIL